MIGLTITLTTIFIVSILLGCIALYNGSEGLGFFSALLIFISGLILFIQISEIVGSKNKAMFYNTTFKTNYTTEDVFWNNDAIKNQLLGEKKNLNIKMEK